ncbi:ciliary microtubule inner protein 2A [Leptodactylus fuscus]
MLQFQHATSYSRMVTNAVDEFLETQSSVTKGQFTCPVDSTQDSYATRHWKPKAEYKTPLDTYKTPKPDLGQNLQHNAIPGYTGFIPRYQWRTGISFAPGVKISMDEFEHSQIQIRYPETSSERRLKPTYWPTAKIYSPAGLLPKYTGFVPRFRDTFGSTYGNTTRQLYIKYPLKED